MKGCIASAHWEACHTCKFNDDGCIMTYTDLSVHMGDWMKIKIDKIVCDNYEENDADLDITPP